jgi:hypothetical protein
MRSAPHRKPLIRNECVEILIDAFQSPTPGLPPSASRNPAGLASMNFRGKFRPGRRIGRRDEKKTLCEALGASLRRSE